MTLRILVAEGNEFNAQLLRQLLGTRGHRCHIASSGDEALQRLEEAEFDLVLIDSSLRGRDGFEVMPRIHQQRSAARSRVPVIALAARLRGGERERCLQAGMDDVVAKPIDASELWAAIERVSPSNQQHRRGVHHRPVDAASWLDARALWSACGGDTVILERVVRSLRTHVPGELARAEAAWSDKDAAGLREAAHRLCGMVAAASTAAGEVASALEDEAAAGRLAQARVLLDRLGPMTRELLSELDETSLESLLGGSESARR